MSFRARLFLAFLLAVIIPLGLLAFGVRREMSRRLGVESERRIASVVTEVRDDLARQSAAVAGRLGALKERLADDNRFRVAALQGDASERRYLLDYAGEAMRLTGLTLLQIQDSVGRIVSSGHFRNEYDRSEPELPALLASARDSVVLLRARTAEMPVLVLARADSVRVGGRLFTLVGGAAVRMAPPHDTLGIGELGVALRYPGSDTVLQQAGRVVGEVALPFIDAVNQPIRADTARAVVLQQVGALAALRRSVDAWFFAALALTGGLALLVALWLAARVSRPLTELAAKTAEIDLDRLDVTFETGRDDEIGALSRLLGTMTQRLRASSARLRDAERRATLGEVSRQVNHDIKNGLAPIRHVLRHLTQVAQQEPANLPAVFEQRRGTLESSVGYLETLARNYARLAPESERRPCNVNEVVQQVVRDASGRAELRLELAPELPKILADPLIVRRILENLLGNAIDSLDGRSAGSVAIATEIMRDGTSARVRVTVADTGRGMTRDELERAFDDFYTTKAGGTGLGLSIVRRLVRDLGGSLNVATEPGAGSQFLVDLPVESEIPG